MLKTPATNPRLQNAVLVLLILAATVAVYAPVLHYPFVDFDDPLYVTENPKVRSGLSAETLLWAFTGASESTNYFAPLTWISFLVDHEISGDDAGGYHRTNLLLHAMNALLLFFLLLKMTGRPWRSWLVAMLFAVHPLHVESVAWVAERKDVLSTFLALLTMLAYRRYAESPSASAYLAAALFFVLGIMAKPMLVTLPFVLLLLDFWPLDRYPKSRTGSIEWKNAPAAAGRMLAEKTPLFAVSVLASVGAYLVQAREGAVASAEAIPWTLRAAVATADYAGYLLKTVWPANLSVVYLYPHRVPTATVVAGAAALLAMTVFALRFGTRRPYLPVGWLWYLGTLFPVIGLVVIGPHAMADRYTYIPLIGIFIAAVWGAADIAKSRPLLEKAMAGAAVVLLCAFSLAAARQVRYWKSTEALFSHAAAVTEDNWFAFNVLGRQYEKSGRLQEALAAYSRSLQIEPEIPETLYLMGGINGKLGKKEAARRFYEKALGLKPDFPTAHNNLASLMLEEGRRKEAIDHYRQALRIHPGYAKARYNLAVALQEEGRTLQASGQYLKVIEADPHFTEAYVNLGVLMYRSGNVSGAKKMFEAALRADPGSVSARQNLEALGKSR